MESPKLRMKDGVFTLLVLGGAFAGNVLAQKFFDIRTLIPMTFVLGVFLISLKTQGYFWGITASLVSVLAVNYAFTFPYYAIDLISPECVTSAVVMLIVAILTGMLTTKIKVQEKHRAESEKERLRANLLRAVSHDLRTPLTSIYGASSTVIENYDLLTRQQRLKLLEEVRGDAQWLIRMVENLLSVTRIDGEGVQIIKTPTVLEELVDAVLMKFRKHCPNQAVAVDIPAEFVSIPMDAMLMEQVLTNILENAVDHAAGMTELILRVTCHGGKARFEIMDDGCGIAPERLFILLWSWRKTMNNRYKILIIEDEQNIRSFVKTTLEANDYHVLVAATCQQGIMMCASHMPDLVILDLGLPDQDGMAFIRQIRRESGVPIIVLSARTMESDKVAALDLGANDYVTKPFGIAELLARVRAALRLRRLGSDHLGKFVLHDLVIDYDRRMVTVAGEEVKLTQTEYNILSMLSEHTGKVLTYAAIIRFIWGSMDDGSIKKLQVNMANIRKKLGSRPGDNRYIINELGVGYRMLEE